MFAEYERKLIGERTRAALVMAVFGRVKRLGRPLLRRDDLCERIIWLHASSMSATATAALSTRPALRSQPRANLPAGATPRCGDHP